MKHLNFNEDRVIGLESIAFQSDDFLNELISTINKYRNGSISDAQLCLDFTKSIEKYTGIWTSWDLDSAEYDNAHIYPSYLTGVNALTSPQLKSYEQFVRICQNPNVRKNTTAYIDSKKCKVGGFLCDIEHKSSINKSFFKSGLSDGAIASVILHELGHAFTYLQYSIRSIVLNVTISQVSKELIDAKSYGAVKIIFEKACDELGIDHEFVKEVKDTTNRVTQFTYFATNASEKYELIPNMDSSDGYSQDAAEILADVFAARFGAAKYVMEVRAYFERSGSASGFYNKAIFMNLAKLLGAVLLKVVAYNSLGLFAVPLILLYSFHTFNVVKRLYRIYTSLNDRHGFTTAFEQIKRMQYQTIERLKSSKNPDKNLINACMEAIDYGNQLLAEFKKNDSIIMTVLSFTNYKMRDARAMKEYQNRLEGLVSNQLFLSSARLSSI